MKKLFWLWPLCLLLSGCFDLSPDGKTLAISGAIWPLSGEKSSRKRTSPEDPFPPVWLVKTDGSGARKIIETGKNEFAGFPIFSPDGKRLALRVDIEGAEQKVEWRIFELVSLKSRTFEFGRDRVLSTVWSADSRSLYGLVKPGSTSLEIPEKILQIDAESGQRLREWSLGKLRTETLDKWQSDSRGNLLFLASQNERRDIYALSPQGLRPLTTTGDVMDFVETTAGERVWIRAPFREVGSPNPSAIQKAKKREMLPLQIWRFDPLSQKPVGAPFGWRPQKEARVGFSLSPDAKSLVCAEALRTESKRWARCLWMNADGTNAKELYRSPIESYQHDDIPSIRSVIYPRWSDDSQTLAVLCGSERHGTFLLVGDGQGRNLRKLPAPKIP